MGLARLVRFARRMGHLKFMGLRGHNRGVEIATTQGLAPEVDELTKVARGGRASGRT